MLIFVGTGKIPPAQTTRVVFKMDNTHSNLPPQALRELKEALHILENPSLAARITNTIGRPIEKGFGMLPDNWNNQIGKVTQSALIKASDAAFFSVNGRRSGKASNNLHKLGIAITGGVGGFFGLAGLALELPVSTTIILRSIADVARSEGEAIEEKESKEACLEVLALGGPSTADDATDSGYYAVRAMMAHSIASASRHVATRGLTEEGAPAVLRLITAVAPRFGIQVTEKAAAQALPFIGAASGALINTIFIDHFQQTAKGHFTVRRLERRYGQETIRAAYEQIRAETI